MPLRVLEALAVLLHQLVNAIALLQQEACVRRLLVMRHHLVHRFASHLPVDLYTPLLRRQSQTLQLVGRHACQQLLKCAIRSLNTELTPQQTYLCRAQNLVPSCVASRCSLDLENVSFSAHTTCGRPSREAPSASMPGRGDRKAVRDY